MSARAEKYGSRPTVSFVFLADQNPAKLWQNLAKFVRIYQKCCILRKSQHFLDNLAKFRQILTGIGAKFIENSSKILIFAEKLAKNLKTFDNILLIFLILRGAKECQSCRSRKMLQNEYLIARIGADAEENEPSKIC